VGTPGREELQQVIRRLKGVEAAQVYLNDAGEISEIHVAAAPGNRPKNIARDVRTYLAAALNIQVSHQKISVAAVESNSPAPGIEPKIGPPAVETPTQPSAEMDRILFRSVNLLVEGLRTEVQVDLIFGDRDLTGCATGVPALLGTERLIAMATLQALESILNPDLRLIPGDLSITNIGSGAVVISEVILVQARREQHLIGACPVGQDRHRSVVFAVLSALNRILGKVSQPSEWVEYQVVPEGS
jgi:hypothetical protein